MAPDPTPVSVTVVSTTKRW